MSKKNQTDSVVVVDRSSRRQFIRAGAAFVVGAGAIAGEALASDCDQNPKQKTRCTDQDSGQDGDPDGCGRCGQLVPTAMPRRSGETKGGKIPRVEKIVV